VKKGEETRARMVDATARLLMTQGFHGTGLGQVLAEARAPKGSLYFHFPGGKEELAAEAVRKSAAEWREAVLAVVAASPNPLKSLRNVCELLATRLEASAFQDGCPVATIALEAAPTSDLIHEATNEAYRTWQGIIEERMRALGLPEARAERLATTVLAAIEGALVLAKASRSGEPLRRVGTELEALLVSAVPR
jgi:TetR/AcrR family transcriptional repressor of lmrAB and yxaGH operons